MSVAPFQPITKEQAAEVLGASIRTVENYVSTGVMPAPVTIGRRVYWHPDVFYGWLDARLKGASINTEVENLEIQAIPEKTTHDEPTSTIKQTASVQISGSAGTRSVKKATAKSKALIAELCGD